MQVQRDFTHEKLPRMAGLDVVGVNGSYAGEEYTARSREMLVVLEAKWPQFR